MDYLCDIVINRCGDSVKKHNKMVFDYCTNTFEMLFIGTLFVKTNELVYEHDSFIKDWVKYETEPEHIAHTKKIAEDEWNTMYRQITWANDPLCSSIHLKQIYGRDKIIDEKIHHFEDITITNPVITKEQMENDFLRRCGGRNYLKVDGKEYLENDESEKFVHMRCDRIFDYCSNMNYDISHSCPYTFEITYNTVLNTRNLLSKSYKLNLYNINLDKLEDKIKSGKRIFCINISEGGEGMNNFALYQTSGDKDVFDKIDGVEFIEDPFY